jgi:hypothetical protein
VNLVLVPRFPRLVYDLTEWLDADKPVSPTALAATARVGAGVVPTSPRR